MAAALAVVRRAPRHPYALAPALAVHHKLRFPVAASVRIQTHNSAVLEEVVEVVCCSCFVGSLEKDESLMSSNRCRTWDGHHDDDVCMMRYFVMSG